MKNPKEPPTKIDELLSIVDTSSLTKPELKNLKRYLTMSLYISLSKPITERELYSMINTSANEEYDYLKRLEKKVLNNELIPRPAKCEEAYSPPRKRNPDCHRFPNNDVYTNKRVGNYNELVEYEEAEQIQFDIEQVSAWFNFTSDLAKRVYYDDWDDHFLIKSQGRLLHYYILFKFDKKLTAEAMNIEINSLDHNLRTLFKKLDKFPILRDIQK